MRYGTTADHVRGLSVVFANGEAAEVGFEPWSGADDEIPRELQGARRPQAGDDLPPPGRRLRPPPPPLAPQPRRLRHRRRGHSGRRRPRPPARRLGGDAGPGHRGHAPHRADPRGAGRGRPAVRPDRRRGRRGRRVPPLAPLGVRAVRLAVDQPGPRRAARDAPLDRRAGRVGARRRARRRRPGRGARPAPQALRADRAVRPDGRRRRRGDAPGRLRVPPRPPPRHHPGADADARPRAGRCRSWRTSRCRPRPWRRSSARLQDHPQAVRGQLDRLRPRRRRPAPHPAVPRHGRAARRGQARADGLDGPRRGARPRRLDLRRARLRPGADPSSSAARPATSTTPSARSRTPSTPTTSSTPARWWATTRT